MTPEPISIASATEADTVTDVADTDVADTDVADAAETARADTLADALDRLAHHGFTDGAGLAHHAPMGAEALSALGHDDRVSGWVDAYNHRFAAHDLPPAVAPLDPTDAAGLGAALGDPSRLGDWAVLFDRLLADQPWPDVARAWLPRLLPGYGGAFTHGLLRTAHAVRTAESVGDTPATRHELARALAFWAGTYTELPGARTVSSTERPQVAGDGGTLSLDDAIARLPHPSEPWPPEEAGRFVHIHELGGFAAAVDAHRRPVDADAALGDLTLACARLLLVRADVHPFSLVHAVTPVAAARSLVPYVAGGGAEVYAAVWRVDAAIAASFLPPGTLVPTAEQVDTAGAPEPAELAARAAAHGDVHVIKFAEACLREHARRPDPSYLAAPARLAEAMPPWW